MQGHTWGFFLTQHVFTLMRQKTNSERRVKIAIPHTVPNPIGYNTYVGRRMKQTENQTQKHVPEISSRNTENKSYSEFLLRVFPDSFVKNQLFIWTSLMDCISVSSPKLNKIMLFYLSYVKDMTHF